MWNSLPEEVVGAASVNCFKGRFDRCCIRNRFSMEWEKITGRHRKDEEERRQRILDEPAVKISEDRSTGFDLQRPKHDDDDDDDDCRAVEPS